MGELRAEISSLNEKLVDAIEEKNRYASKLDKYRRAIKETNL